MGKNKRKEFMPKDRLKLTRKWGILGYLDSVVFLFSAIICFGFIFVGVFYHELLGNVLEQALEAIVSKWKWLFQGGVLFFIVFCFYIAFSKYGKIKFGKDADVPEYSRFSWFSMLFGAGMGVGLVYWSVAEPIFHFLNGPTYAGVPGTAEAAEWSLAISNLHWGISPWAIYVALGIPMAFVMHRKGLPSLVSSCFYPILGNKIYGPIGKAIDIITLCITFFGVSTTVGLGTMELGSGLALNYGVTLDTRLYMIILIVVTGAYLASACLPIGRGIKIGSNISMFACVALLVFLFVLGPTSFIMDNLVNSVGIYLQNFIRMSTWTDPVSRTGWLNSWTVFYWAWWISWAPFVGVFIAKISKGRTIKEFVIAALIVPTVFDIVFFDIIGSTALSFELDEVTKGVIEQAVNNDEASGIFILFSQFPLEQITIPLLLLVIFTFFVVSTDSATIVLGMFSSGGDHSPKTSLKLLWGIALALAAAVLMILGGLHAVQTISIVAVFPFVFIMFLSCYATLKMVKKDFSVKIDISDRMGDNKKMKIAVVGSINMDMIIHADRIPLKGETISGSRIEYQPGGKGSNQAVAMAKLGAQVTMFGCVGKDAVGEQLIQNMKECGVNTTNIKSLAQVSTGQAVIVIGEEDNTIIVIGGANDCVDVAYVKQHQEQILQSDIIVLQNEIPREAVAYTIRMGHEHGKKIIWNPAPARKLEDELLEMITYLTPNEHEVRAIWGEQEALESLMKRYSQKLIITQGAKGVSLYHKAKGAMTIPAMAVKVKDTTGAGDTLNGAFCVGLSKGMDEIAALRFANAAAGLSVQRYGAQKGMPDYQEVQHILESVL